MSDMKLSEEYKSLHSWHPEFYGKLQRLESQVKEVEELKELLKANLPISDLTDEENKLIEGIIKQKP